MSDRITFAIDVKAKEAVEAFAKQLSKERGYHVSFSAVIREWLKEALDGERSSSRKESDE